jgi:hypothetical protein
MCASLSQAVHFFCKISDQYYTVVAFRTAEWFATVAVTFSSVCMKRFNTADPSFVMSVCLSVLQYSDNSCIKAAIIFVGRDIFTFLKICKHVTTSGYTLMMMMIMIIIIIIIILIITGIVHTNKRQSRYILCENL